jgi:hypothetical protein
MSNEQVGTMAFDQVYSPFLLQAVRKFILSQDNLKSDQFRLKLENKKS